MLFLGISSWKGASRFNGGGSLFFSWVGFIFKRRVHPMGGSIGFDGWRVRVSKKIVGWEGVPPDAPSLWKTLELTFGGGGE